MKNVQLRLISELMRNCRRSDRELAKALGVSQPTVSRMIKKLEKKGYITGYSAIPDFSRIGFEILAITFTKLKDPLNPEKLATARTDVRGMMSRESAPAVIGMSGIGLNSDRVLVTLHEDYSTYLDLARFIKSQPVVEVEGVKSFLVDLTDKTQFLPPASAILQDIFSEAVSSVETSRPLRRLQRNSASASSDRCC